MLGNDAPGAAQSQTPLQRDDHRTLARVLSQVPANRFLHEVLAQGLGGVRGHWDTSELCDRLDDPVLCLRATYTHYAFSRRGKDRRALAKIAGDALESALDGANSLVELSIERVWQHFCEACEATGRKPFPDLNRGVVLGLAGLAQAVARDKGVSMAKHAANAAREHGRVEAAFFGIVELRGVGPKVAATMLRDWIYAYGAEESVVHRDSIYLQPIDRWTRAVAPYLLEDAGPDEFPDWILAGKLGKAARNAGVSGIRLNMGIAWLGIDAAASPAPEARFVELLRSLSTP